MDKKLKLDTYKFDHDLEIVAAAVRELIPEKNRDRYFFKDGLFYAPHSNIGRSNVGKILERTEFLEGQKRLKEHGKPYTVEFRETVRIYAESREQAELLAESVISVKDMPRTVTEG